MRGWASSRRHRTTASHHADAEAGVVSLVDSISRLKEEYAALISEAEVLKASKNTIDRRVARSEGLLAGLESEQRRWAARADRFPAEAATLAGDAVVAPRFLCTLARRRRASERCSSRHLRRAVGGDDSSRSPRSFGQSLPLAPSTQLDRVRRRRRPSASAGRATASLSADLCVENAIILPPNGGAARRYPHNGRPGGAVRRHS